MRQERKPKHKKVMPTEGPRNIVYCVHLFQKFQHVVMERWEDMFLNQVVILNLILIASDSTNNTSQLLNLQTYLFQDPFAISKLLAVKILVTETKSIL
ncbi:unnamed protein product [Vicia faba]|uniref:Uncharacterized protein n=1 Tax=Vicia faba TaxID=3906 RepID=A0AAV1AM43_VICFA|nr:unnamed protein product [Vicia faba]